MEGNIFLDISCYTVKSEDALRISSTLNNLLITSKTIIKLSLDKQKIMMHVFFSICMHMWLHVCVSLFALLTERCNVFLMNLNSVECETRVPLEASASSNWFSRKEKHLQVSWTSHTATPKVTAVRRCWTRSLSRSSQMRSVRTISSLKQSGFYPQIHSQGYCAASLDFIEEDSEASFQPLSFNTATNTLFMSRFARWQTYGAAIYKRGG